MKEKFMQFSSLINFLDTIKYLFLILMTKLVVKWESL